MSRLYCVPLYNSLSWTHPAQAVEKQNIFIVLGSDFPFLCEGILSGFSLLRLVPLDFTT